jgi:peroxiredoxin Q/BCP
LAPRSPLWWDLYELARLAFVIAVVVASAVAAGSVLVMAIRLAFTSGARWRLRWWLHRRAARRFVAAVADGNPDRAERAAQRILGRIGRHGAGLRRPAAPLRSRRPRRRRVSGVPRPQTGDPPGTERCVCRFKPVMQPGDTASDFEARTQDGEKVRLSDYLADGPVVLFFYPRAMTRGCTAESCHFRDLAAEFTAVGATRLGISPDAPDRQAAFVAKEALDYPLLSDPDRSIARAFGVKRPGPLFNRRMTFVIDTDRTVIDVIASETNMNAHADGALEALRSRRRWDCGSNGVSGPVGSIGWG